ncbi:Uncharacterized protein SCF082_LOCUS48045, partial [Durusdinium trenchii]
KRVDAESIMPGRMHAETRPQHLATLGWAMAIARVEDTFQHAGNAMDAVAQQAAFSHHLFSAQNVAITLWAFAKLLQAPEPLLFLFRRHVRRNQFRGFEAMPIAATVWALARIAEVSEHATRHNAFRIQLVRRGCEQLSDFSEQGIANLSFALAAGMKPARSSIQPSSRSKRPE